MRAWLPLLLLAAGCSSTATRPSSGIPGAPPRSSRSDRLAGPPRHPATHDRVAPTAATEPPAATSRRDAPIVPPGHRRNVLSPLVALAAAGAASLAISLLVFGVLAWRESHRARRRPLRSVIITTGLPATAHDADLNCAYCRSTLRGEIVYCAACATPYHADCARQLTACAIYACGSLAFHSGRQTAFVPALRT